MGTQFSRRDLLKGAMLAGAALPFSRFNGFLAQWRRDEYGDMPGTGGTPAIRLNSNENPFGPSEKARQALIAAISQGNRYPRPAMINLQQKIADHEGLNPEQILISAGSTELLGLGGLMAGIDKGKVISSHPTFPFLMQYASRFAAEWVKVPETSDHHYNLAGINEKLDSQTKLVFLCNPNNPTGSELPRAMLEPFCSIVSQRCIVYVDEAYIELSSNGLKSSLASLTRDNRNIIVGRTFSKIYGMAGLRVGYAIAHPDTIARMEDLMMGGNVTPSVTSLDAAAACIGDTEFFQYCKDMNDQARDMVAVKFKSWGVEYVPSVTNFIFFRTDRFGSVNIVDALKERNILIRSYSDVPGWARVSMGALDEMEMFLNATQELLV